VAEPELELAPEPDVVLAEFEAELVIEEPVVVEAVESERRQAPAWEADAPSFAVAVVHEAEREAPRTNGHHDYVSAAPRTLEDSVKDMLRPMLRQWLDENMARVLTSALKDELKDNPARFQQD
jgi:cell pole-organizing protein PopZ